MITVENILNASGIRKVDFDKTSWRQYMEAIVISGYLAGCRRPRTLQDIEDQRAAYDEARMLGDRDSRKGKKTAGEPLKATREIADEAVQSIVKLMSRAGGAQALIDALHDQAQRAVNNIGVSARSDKATKQNMKKKHAGPTRNKTCSASGRRPSVRSRG